MNFRALAAILLAVAVALGAFGAHGLKGRLDAYAMGIWEKAVFYHFVHALGMLIVAGWQREYTGLVCWLFTAGILLFSGSLYTLALTRILTLAAITPLGGVAFIAAWLLLAYRLSVR